jgi:hypothetical protein
LDGDGLAESRRDGARLLRHRDNGGGRGHADNGTRLAGIGDNVASMETERIIHGRFIVGEQSRLRCLGCKPCLLCLGSLAGDAVAIKRNLGKQVECVRRKSELMLRQRQAAFVPFHGVNQAARESAGK